MVHAIIMCHCVPSAPAPTHIQRKTSSKTLYLFMFRMDFQKTLIHIAYSKSIFTAASFPFLSGQDSALSDAIPLRLSLGSSHVRPETERSLSLLLQLLAYLIIVITILSLLLSSSSVLCNNCHCYYYEYCLINLIIIRYHSVCFERVEVCMCI